MKTKPIKADLTDIIFEGRFRAYGAYQLRKLYNQRLAIATFIGLGLFFAGIGAPNLIPGKKRLNHGVGGASSFLDTVLVRFPEQKKGTSAPQIPEPEIIICGGWGPFAKLTEYHFKMPTPKKINKLSKEESLNVNREFIHVDTDTPRIDSVPTIFYPEGMPPVNYDSILGLIGYPKLARENEIEGTVIIRVRLDRTGKVTTWKTIKHVHPILSEAVQEHIDKLRFRPIPPNIPEVLLSMNVPFRFQLLK